MAMVGDIADAAQLPLSSAAWTVGGVVAYLALYTAYDKKTKTLASAGLLDVLLARKGADHTLVQMNKVISLVGLTNVAVALAPCADALASNPAELLMVSTALLTVHSCYSLYRYYDSPNIPVLSSFTSVFSDLQSDSAKTVTAGKRKLSLEAGLAAQLLLQLFYLGDNPTPATSAAMLTLGVVHFYLMEVDFKNQLAVRPFGYLAFLAPAAALAAHAANLLLDL